MSAGKNSMNVKYDESDACDVLVILILRTEYDIILHHLWSTFSSFDVI